MRICRLDEATVYPMPIDRKGMSKEWQDNFKDKEHLTLQDCFKAELRQLTAGHYCTFCRDNLERHKAPRDKAKKYRNAAEHKIIRIQDEHDEKEMVAKIEYEQGHGRTYKTKGYTAQDQKMLDELRPLRTDNTEDKQWTRLRDPPEMFLISLRRFLFIESKAVKINDHIDIPEILDVTGFLEYRDHPHHKVQYRLAAVVCHRGTLTHGHYITYARRDNIWYCLNDDKVEKVDFDQINEPKSEFTPYVLSYEKMYETDQNKGTSRGNGDAAKHSKVDIRLTLDGKRYYFTAKLKGLFDSKQPHDAELKVAVTDDHGRKHDFLRTVLGKPGRSTSKSPSAPPPSAGAATSVLPSTVPLGSPTGVKRKSGEAPDNVARSSKKGKTAL